MRISIKIKTKKSNPSRSLVDVSRPCRYWASAVAAVASLFLLIGSTVLVSSCSKRNKIGNRPTRNEYSVMSFNLDSYGLKDHDGDGQCNDLKPERERNAVIEVISEMNPDILLIQEIGNPDIFQTFRKRLADQTGVEYSTTEYLQRSRSENNIALLSKYPLVEKRSHTDDTYTVDGESMQVLRGIIDVTIRIAPQSRLRIMSAHLKSKVYHPLGQTEMRRNEARILGQYVRNSLEETPKQKLLVAGTFNDLIDSAPLKEIMGDEQTILDDICPRDQMGDAWTHRNSKLEVYRRIDYLLASPSLCRNLIAEKSRIINFPATRQASDHRPLFAVFSK